MIEQVVHSDRDLRQLAIVEARSLSPVPPSDPDEAGSILPEVVREVLTQSAGERPHLVMPEIDRPVSALSWSPRGDLLAFVVDGPEPTGQSRSVMWASPTLGERGRIRGGAFAWTPGGRSLIVADIEEGKLLRVGVDAPDGAGRPEVLAELSDDGALAFPPRIAVSPSGDRLAVSCRESWRDRSSLFVIERRGGGSETSLVTEIPGTRAFVWPFWSPRGNTLGVSVSDVELDKSAVILWWQLRGRGVVIRNERTIDAPVKPCWSARYGIALMAGRGPTAGAGDLDERGRPVIPPQRPILVDPESGASRVVETDHDVVGQPRFVCPPGTEECLVIDGGVAAAVIPPDRLSSSFRVVHPSLRAEA